MYIFLGNTTGCIFIAVGFYNIRLVVKTMSGLSFGFSRLKSLKGGAHRAGGWKIRLGPLELKSLKERRSPGWRREDPSWGFLARSPGWRLEDPSRGFLAPSWRLEDPSRG